MEGKLCDLCRGKVREKEEDWPEWNLKNLLKVRDLCGKCRAAFSKLVKQFRADKIKSR